MANLDWDATLDEIEINEEEEREYITLPEGDYKFKVSDFNYDDYNGSEKIPACKKARLSAKVETEDGTAYASYNFYLYEGKGIDKIYKFLKAVGLDDKSKSLGYLFNKAVQDAAEGTAHIKPSEYNGKTYNNIVYFKTRKENEPTSTNWEELD